MALEEKKVVFTSRKTGDVIIVPYIDVMGQDVLRSFRMAKEEMLSGHMSFGIRKQSPLLEPMSVMLLRIIEVMDNTHTSSR